MFGIIIPSLINCGGKRKLCKSKRESENPDCASGSASNERLSGRENRKADGSLILPYPSIKGPTTSAKKRREEEILKEKKEKISQGFYQAKSDEDDTLEQIKSLKEEQSEQSKKNSPKKKNK